MRVCLVTFEYPPRIIGGMGTYAEQLVRGLRKREIDTYVIAKGDTTSYADNIFRIRVTDLPYWRRFFFIKRAQILFDSLNKNLKFDIIHLNGTYPISRKFGIPTICTLHAPPNVKQIGMIFQSRNFRSIEDAGYLILKAPLGSIFDITTGAVSDGIICPSSTLADEVPSKFLVDKNKIHVIPNGIDLQKMDRARCHNSEFLHSLGIEQEKFILYMGRLSFLKGVEYLIEAFKGIRKQHPELKLVIAGSGNSEHHLRKAAGNLAEIVFVGHVDSIELKKLLFISSLAVVLPSSLYEVSPMVLLEAMACGKPVIATNVGGNSCIIRNGVNGFLSRPQNSADLAKLINVLYDDKVRAKKMGSLGRKIVEDEFTMEKMVDRTIEVYQHCLDAQTDTRGLK